MANGLRLTMTSEEYQRCERIQALMSDKDVKWYFDYLRNKYVQNWEEADEPQVRESMWYQMKALEDVRLLMTTSVGVKEAFDSQEKEDKS